MHKQAGFSYVIGFIVTAIMGIMTLTAADSYSAYTQRAVISTGLQLADDLKKSVSVHLSSTGKFPRSNAEIDMPDGEVLAHGGISYLGLGTTPVDGTITITFRNNGAIADGDRLILVPTVIGSRVKWHCNSSTIFTDLLPDACRISENSAETG